MGDHNDKKRGGKKQLSQYRKHHNSCEICGEKDGRLEIHHINPVENGRNNRTENLVRLCKLHHLVGNYVSRKDILEKKAFIDVLKNFEKTEYFRSLYKSKRWQKYVTFISERGFDKNFCVLYDIPRQHEIYKFLNGRWKDVIKSKLQQ